VQLRRTEKSMWCVAKNLNKQLTTVNPLKTESSASFFAVCLSPGMAGNGMELTKPTLLLKPPKMEIEDRQPPPAASGDRDSAMDVDSSNSDGGGAPSGPPPRLMISKMVRGVRRVPMVSLMISPVKILCPNDYTMMGNY
jgi:hypothetical protein